MRSKLWKWIWQRLQDMGTTLDILDWIGWKTTGVAMLAAIGAGITTLLNGAPLYWVLSLALVSGLVVVCCVIAWQLYRLRRDGSALLTTIVSTPRPLVVEFEENGFGAFCRWEGDNPPGALATWYVRIYNGSPIDVESVEVKLETEEQLTDLVNARNAQNPTVLGIALPFEHGGFSRTIRGLDREWVKVIAYCRNPVEMWLRIGDVADHAGPLDHWGKIFHPHEPHRLDIAVRGRGVNTVSVQFLVQVEGSGLFTMRRL